MAIIPDSIEFNIIFWVTACIVVVKGLMIIYMEIKIRKKKAEGSIAITFIRAVFVVILCLLVSRIFYMIFDFYYTKFDTLLYPGEPQIWYWKTGQLIAGLGQVYLVLVTDRKILNFKFKGIFAYILLAGLIFGFFYPINTMADFEFISTISIIPMLGILIVLIVFINIAIKSSGRVRRTAVILVIAFLIYTLAALLVNAGIISALESAIGVPVDVYMYLIQSVLKAIGITMLAIGASRWGN
ncbi:MAG: hypothetical protein ACTSUE_08600 [Promethearchaeota archaeon]